MHKLKLLLHYYKVLLAFNLPFSIFMSLTGFMFNDHIAIHIINSFSLCLLTGGLFISVFFFEQRYSDQYYFYYNKGLSKVQLITGTFMINFLVIIPLYILKVYLYA